MAKELVGKLAGESLKAPNQLLSSNSNAASAGVARAGKLIAAELRKYASNQPWRLEFSDVEQAVKEKRAELFPPKQLANRKIVNEPSGQELQASQTTRLRPRRHDPYGDWQKLGTFAWRQVEPVFSAPTTLVIQAIRNDLLPQLNDAATQIIALDQVPKTDKDRAYFWCHYVVAPLENRFPEKFADSDQLADASLEAIRLLDLLPDICTLLAELIDPLPKTRKKPVGGQRLGRPHKYDPKEDRRIATAWLDGRQRKYLDLGRSLGLQGTGRNDNEKNESIADQVKQAVDRHRKRVGSRPTE